MIGRSGQRHSSSWRAAGAFVGRFVILQLLRFAPGCWWGLLFQPRASVSGERRPLVEKLAELFKDFSQVHDVFLDDPSSLRFAGLFVRAKLAVGWFASVLFRVRHHVSRFSLCRPQCVSLREELNSRTWPRFNALMMPMRANIGGPCCSATSNNACIAACH